MKPTKLWIDDLRNPKDYVPDPENWHWVKSYHEALRSLYNLNKEGASRTDWTHVSFDHDLGERPDKSPALSGYEIAREIERDAAENQKIKPFHWTIHSANPIGADRIRMALISAERFWKESQPTK